jgi:predicted PurR-regulated permease PerM
MKPKILAEPNNLWWIVPAAAVVALLYFLSPILAPFLFAAILAYISSPVLGWLACQARVEPGALLRLRHLGSQYRNCSRHKE